MPSLNNIKKLCAELDIKPTKSKGQNFLIDKNILAKIISTANLQANDTILEIGPGFGTLTQALIKNTKQVISVELDKKLFNFLTEEYKTTNNLELIQGDIIELLRNPNSQLAKLKNYKVIANLPYQITSHFLRLILERPNKPTEITLMIQKEVAERICAQPGRMSVLSVMVQYYTDPQILFTVSQNSFWPAPAVNSALIKLKTKQLNSSPDFDKKLFKTIKTGFSSKRKMLKNNLGNIYDKNKLVQIFSALNLNPKTRAQNLSIPDWINLTKKLTSQ